MRYLFIDLARRKLPLLIILFLLADSGDGQTPDQKRWLEDFSKERANAWQRDRIQAESLAVKVGMPVRIDRADGWASELQRFENGRPRYYITTNLNAARTVSTNRVWPGGSGGFSLTGSTDSLGIWDAGRVRGTHQELTGRVTQVDGSPTNHWHSTHVAGTMIATGVDANAKGMSYQGILRAYDWNSDQSEMASAAAAGLRASNHSYSLITGWLYDYFGDSRWTWWGDTAVSNVEDFWFGFYSSEAQGWDNIARNAPNYLIVKSAGNDRNEGPAGQPVQHWVFINGNWVLRTVTRNLDGTPGGYDCISDAGVAKNVLTVGAVNDIPAGYTQPSDVVMTSFSAWGPADDGRIKPDIVANGMDLYSTNSTSNTAYTWSDGTSMSAPNVTGSLGLLFHHHKNLGGSGPLRSATVKALVIHTADEAGSGTGPDYAFGWGLMNTLRAVQVMSANAQAGGNKNIRELTLTQGQTITIGFGSNGSPCRATICWTDPPASSPAPSLDPPTAMLVNDLDLRLIKGPSTFLPWVLNPASPSSPPTTGDNVRDNVEQVYIASPVPGAYAVQITHKGILSGGSQQVSLVLTGATFDSSITLNSPNGGEAWGVGSQQTIQWTSSNLTGNVKIELSRNGGATFPEILFANTANDGVENWTVTGSSTSSARVRISGVTSPGVADTSNANFTIVQPFVFLTRLMLRDNGNEKDTLDFGTAAGATPGIDPQFGESELPPIPPGGAFDVRWEIPGAQGSLRDVRDTLVPSTQILYNGLMQAGVGGYPFTLQWYPAELPPGRFSLRDKTTGGLVFNIDMKMQDSLVVSSPAIAGFEITYTDASSVSSPMIGGWNMVSLPLTVADRRKTTVFPTSSSDAFTYTPSGYTARDTLRYGEGYWLKFPSAQTVSIVGEARDRDTIDVVSGWNMIGSISGPVPTDSIIQIPSAIVISPYFGGTPTGYVVEDTVHSMRGYWVKVSQNGQLILVDPAGPGPAGGPKGNR